MTKDIFSLADKFAKVTKTAGKQRLSRSRISKALDKAKQEYSKMKDSMDVLEANDAKLRAQLDGTRKNVQDARAQIMKMHKAMQNMDLANANDAIFYDGNSADDIGYVINGKEYHLDINDCGEVTIIPMNKFKKSKKEVPAESADVKEDSGSEDFEPEETTDEEEPKEGEEDFDSLYSSLVE